MSLFIAQLKLHFIFIDSNSSIVILNGALTGLDANRGLIQLVRNITMLEVESIKIKCNFNCAVNRGID